MSVAAAVLWVLEEVVFHNHTRKYVAKLSTMISKTERDSLLNFPAPAIIIDGKKKEYIKRHNEIWNEMLQVLNDAGIKNYSIWIDGSDVFGYYDGEKGMPGKTNTNHGLTTYFWQILRYGRGVDIKY